MNKKSNEVKELRIQDPYNKDKIWLIRKYRYHIKVAQLINNIQQHKLQRFSKKFLLSIFENNKDLCDKIKKL